MSRAGALTALSLLVFAAVFGVHGYLAMFPAVDPALARWAVEEPTFSARLGGYYTTGALWLGYSYALSAGFGVFCLGRWLLAPTPLFKMAGGVTLSGALAGGACFLTGCCGSPMLGVWISVFGASAAGYLGPVAALLTTVMTALAGWGLFRKTSNNALRRECC